MVGKKEVELMALSVCARQLLSLAICEIDLF